MAGLTFGELGPTGAVLCLGAHCDDVEIGCGATLVDLAERWPDLEFHVVVFCSDEQRERETRQSLAHLLGENVSLTMHFAGLRDGYLPYCAVEAKEYLVDKVHSLVPGMTITHCRHDLHQDHRFVAEITYQVIRNGLILEMEIPKFDGDLGRPNVYVPVSQSAIDRKISSLMSSYPSQTRKHWFSEETFMAILRLRGIECRAESGMAEAFYASKIIIS